MASKRRLSDVLREEAGGMQKPADGAAKPDENDKATTKSSARSRSAAARGTTAKTTAKTSAAQPTATAKTTTTSPRAASRATTSAQADDTATSAADSVDELKAALEKALENEAILQRKVEGLEQELAEQVASVKALQADTRDMAKLKQELDDAKSMILRLSEQKAEQKPPVAEAAKPAAQKNSAPLAPATRKAESSAHTTSLELRRVLQSPISPEPPSTQLTSNDIGWMD
ncbi:hypothetical protein ACQ4M4_27455 [Leptolyngbya sp. AN02str]|uniref:hypothetical protein n=1 Tax=Leptolyngbya sp. AN02str TaxID=3423363 RepID=UPI003D31BA2F